MKKIKDIVKSILSDFVFWIYIWSCLVFLAIEWEFIQTYQIFWIISAAICFTMIFNLAGDSIGRKLFLSSPRLNKKWKKTFSGWFIVFSLVLTFVVGYNIVQVDLYKFFTKFKNAGGIASGIFDPNITTYKISSKTITNLKNESIDKSVLEKIEKLKYKSYPSKKTFIKGIKKILTEQEYKKYHSVILDLTSKNNDMLYKSLSALAETIFLALLATVFAIPFAFVLSFFAARNLMPKTFIGNSVYIGIRTLATFFRSVEAIVWAIIFSVWVGIGPFAGMLALMVHSVAALTKLYSEQIENIDNGPVEAITATGANTLQIWIFSVVPQILSPYLAFTIYRWDINVRMATIVGFVGGGGIGLLLQQQQQMLQWRNVGLIVWLIAIVVWTMDMSSAKIREKLLEK